MVNEYTKRQLCLCFDRVSFIALAAVVASLERRGRVGVRLAAAASAKSQAQQRTESGSF